jgi:hypothetical protein
MFYVLSTCKCVLPPGVNPTAVDKYIDIDININNTEVKKEWSYAFISHCTLMTY